MIEMAVKPLEDDALLTEVARSLVEHPSHVRVVVEDSPAHRTMVLHLHVARSDRGRIIGKKGRTISALRNLFSAVGLMDGRRVVVKLAD
jgi:predicted RNA-binding protein YlqC (UPF0109 family)